MSNIISVRDLDLWYGNTQALKKINISIEENTITALIGPSGCGKSTFLKTLNRMNDLVEGCRIEGEICLDGVDVYKDMDVNILRKKVGMVFQHFNLISNLTVMENLTLAPVKLKLMKT